MSERLAEIRRRWEAATLGPRRHAFHGTHEVERLNKEAGKWEPTCPVSGRPCASPLCRDMGCDLVTDLEPDDDRLAERSASKPGR